jgi:hypothetical protein
MRNCAARDVAIAGDQWRRMFLLVSPPITSRTFQEARELGSARGRTQHAATPPHPSAVRTPRRCT